MDSVVWRLLASSLFRSSSLILPVRIAWLMIYNTSVDEISFLKVVFSITVAFFEIPTGIVADLVSRKMSIAISALLFSSHSLCYILFPNFWGFIGTQVLLGLSTTFLSGADTAYLHSHLDTAGRDAYATISGRMEFISKLVSAGFSLLSSILFSLSQRTVFVVSAILGLISFFIVLSLPDKQKTLVPMKDLQISHLKENFQHGLKLFTQNSNIRNITLITAIVTSFLIFSFEMYQVKFGLMGIPSKWNGPIYASFMIIMGFGSSSARNMLRSLKHNNTVRVLVGSLSLSFIIFSLADKLYLVFFAIILQQFAFGCWEIIVNNFLLDNCKSDEIKSTVISMNSLIINMIKGVIVGSLGILANMYSLPFIYLALGICLPLFTTLVFFPYKKKKSPPEPPMAQ